MASLLLKEKNRVVEYPDDMPDEDIQHHVNVTEYGKTPRLSLMQTVLTSPIAEKSADFLTKVMPIEDWEKVGKKAEEAIKSVPKLFVSAASSSGKIAMMEDTSEEEKDKLRNELAKIQAGVLEKATDLEMKKMDALAKIQTAEAQSEHWVTANWRPIASLMFISVSSSYAFKFK